MKYNYFSFLNYPIDRGIKFRGKPIIGSNKTYRGVLAYVFGSIIVSVILWILIYRGATWVHWVYFYNPVILGLLFGLSYSLGEIINSIIKRRLNIGPGKQSKKYGVIQRVFDLSDGPIMVTIVLIVVYGFSYESLLALPLGVLVHYVSEVIMARLRIKSSHNKKHARYG